ncbi:hypothetical protein RUM43_009552, partial [Polyplax serrata]
MQNQNYNREMKKKVARERLTEGKIEVFGSVPKLVTWQNCTGSKVSVSQFIIPSGPMTIILAWKKAVPKGRIGTVKETKGEMEGDE